MSNKDIRKARRVYHTATVGIAVVVAVVLTGLTAVLLHLTKPDMFYTATGHVRAWGVPELTPESQTVFPLSVALGAQFILVAALTIGYRGLTMRPQLRVE